MLPMDHGTTSMYEQNAPNEYLKPSCNVVLATS